MSYFFFACEDETSLNGFKNPNSKFKGKYIEIPLETSNLLLGDIRTSNNYFTGETNRFLVGEYDDPAFGRVRATALTQFITSSTTRMPANSQIDKITIQLALDLTSYGIPADSTEITIFQILDQQESSRKRTAYSDTDIPWNTDDPVAKGKFATNAALFAEYAKLNADGNPDNDTTIVFKFDVDPDHVFYTRLKDRYTTYSAEQSTAFVNFVEFTKDFPGLAITSSSDENNLILGISQSSQSGVIIHYKTTNGTTTTNGTQTLTFNNPFLFSYNRIDTEREGDLAGLEPFEEQPRDAGNRYIQAGTGQSVKLHLDNFFAFANEMADRNIVINSAQLVIQDVDDAASDFITPPRSLGLRIIGDDNRLLKYIPENAGQTRDSLLFLGLINSDYSIFSRGSLARQVVFNNDSTYFTVNDSGNPSVLIYNSTDHRYSGFVTMLMQRLYREPEEAARLGNFVLYPTDPTTTDLGAKSVNRTLFHSDKVVLRIFYTEPNVNQQD